MNTKVYPNTIKRWFKRNSSCVFCVSASWTSKEGTTRTSTVQDVMQRDPRLLSSTVIGTLLTRGSDTLQRLQEAHSWSNTVLLWRSTAITTLRSATANQSLTQPSTRRQKCFGNIRDTFQKEWGSSSISQRVYLIHLITSLHITPEAIKS